MKNNKVAVLVAAALGLCGCSERAHSLAHDLASSSVSNVSQASWSLSFQRQGATVVSRAERTVEPSGVETLEGTTSFQLPFGRAPLLLEERVQLAASGKLLRAEVVLHRGSRAGDVLQKVVLDSSTNKVVSTSEKGQLSFVVASDAPWMYRGLFADIAPEVSGLTATSAWVAARAAASGGRVVDIDVSARTSAFTIAEQVVFEEDASSLVVVGDEVAEVDRAAVRTIPWKHFVDALDLYEVSLRTNVACGSGPC